MLIGGGPVNAAVTRLEFMNWQLEPNESIEERIARDSYESLTDAERTYHAIWWLLFVAYGPGLLDYFNNIEPPRIAIALNGLATIHANEMRSSLQEALNALPKDYFTHSALSRNESLPQSVVDIICEMESRFTECSYPKEELARFVEINDDHFYGPRTKLELWNSMTKRGADTAPKFTAKVFDRVAEAEKDRPHSSRTCPNCDYPSPDYRPSCKACGYPHGRG
jgi:hypothetical protein